MHVAACTNLVPLFSKLWSHTLRWGNILLLCKCTCWRWYLWRWIFCTNLQNLSFVAKWKLQQVCNIQRDQRPTFPLMENIYQEMFCRWQCQCQCQRQWQYRKWPSFSTHGKYLPVNVFPMAMSVFSAISMALAMARKIRKLYNIEKPTFSSNGECLLEMFLPMAVLDSCAKHYLSCLRL